MTKSDEELMFAYQNGDYQAFQDLYARYSGKVYGFLIRRLKDKEKASEVFQVVFLKLHQSRSSYQIGLAFAPWIFTICRNSYLDFVKSGQEKFNEVISSLEDHPDLAESPRELGPDLDLVLNSISDSVTEDQKHLLKMRYLDEMSFEEISQRLNLTENNVRQRISRTVRKLKQAFRQRGDCNE